MPGRRRCVVILSLSAAISLLTTSCAETKFYQCKNIIEVTMKIANESRNNRDTKDIQKALQVADALEEAAKEMEAIKIQDKQLREYQTGFAKVYRSNAQATRDFVGALQKKDVSAAKLTKKKLQKIGKTEKKLATEMNSYCQGN
ncbi:MAG: hypothetical protein AB4426_09275 [Xenococcaceae cyanobacterium]